MKFVVNKEQLKTQPEQFLRHAGYAYIRDRQTEKDSFVRRLGRDHYPRLHMYISHMGQTVVFNLHLDQKRTSYAGTKRHSAEYDGQVVEQEVGRLKGLVSNQNQDIVTKEESKKKSGFWNKIFSR